MYRFSLLALTVLVACGVSEKKFENEYVAKSCELLVDCAGESSSDFLTFDSASECESFLGAFFSLGTSGCDYDGAAAKDCLAEIKDATCESGEPSACNKVYSGAACGFTSTTSSSGFNSSSSSSSSTY
ncbi:MAG: hypothetical protein ACI8PZ_004556 [Myxococcota bacterium]|jgi:hypothetical protein